MTALSVTDTARIKGYDQPLPRPLTVDAIPSKSKLVSPRAGKSHGFAPPHYPGSAEFDAQLAVVTEVRDQVCRNVWPSEFLSQGNPGGGGARPPQMLVDALGFEESGHPDNPHIAALAVSMDRPLDLGTVLYEALTMLPEYERQYIDFVYGFCAFQTELAIVVAEALDKVFDVKYYYMLERPETVLGVAGTVFCEDEIGAPGHPAYGAGHAAVSGVTAKMLIAKFGSKHESAILDACWQFAAYRTLLGVHYPQDNQCGWDVGQSVELP